jgi:hypothetical protein
MSDIIIYQDERVRVETRRVPHTVKASAIIPGWLAGSTCDCCKFEIDRDEPCMALRLEDESVLKIHGGCMPRLQKP